MWRPGGDDPGNSADGEFVPLGPVTLTDEEQKECQAFWESLMKEATKEETGEETGEGFWAMEKGLGDLFKRSIVALCLLGRAERFAALSNSQNDYGESACVSGAKACSIYPLSINFFDFGLILERLGRIDEARTLFIEFLRRQATVPLNPIDEFLLRERDVESAVKHAKKHVFG